MPQPRIRYRRSPNVVSYWTDQGFLLHNFATDARSGGDPLAVEILDFFDDWRSVDDLYRRLGRFDRPLLARVVEALEKRSLLERSDRPRSIEKAMESWASWNPAGGFFHFTTKDVPYAEPEEAEDHLLEKAQGVPMPPAVKRYPRATRRPLPEPRVDGEFPQVLLARRSWRRFAEQPLDISALATLLGLTFRIQRWTPLPGLWPGKKKAGKVILKTSPSGGARHPLEAYVLAARVKGLPSGLYHYAPDSHSLETLKATATPRQIADYVPAQWWYSRASALIVLTAVFARSEWRYEFPRAYRAVLLEAGHFSQTFLLVATWLGLAPFCSMALADTKIEQDLGLDGVSESVLHAVGVGPRPSGVDWAPLPPPRPPRGIGARKPKEARR
ncbi:MAG TPA: SagB family peptide dehydrogenase [Vicinamibacteria bacterium]|nr:SagB family peptide dehydrogenase [Vicinamibacteria bacterium]